jgi:hypothetical protein
MSDLTIQPEAQSPDGGSSRPYPSGSVRPPRAEDEGLSAREIRWIPVIVPLAALMMLLAAAAVLGTA